MDFVQIYLDDHIDVYTIDQITEDGIYISKVNINQHFICRRDSL